MRRNAWNYRVMDSHLNGLGIYEVYYDEDGNINYFSNNAVSPRGDSLEELKKDLLLYMEALERPILNYDKLIDQFMK
ncbi:hypothetical protein [Gilliamella sp. wkB112]|uniref:hypothetical protein n=1 Tax=Gilliamella sp. wkB112 TaxID=3120257 RepID=UPI00080EB39D|nr:hypothetical protein [Gilliamella apicola]OCG00873.1 hypothetical protein A9G12_03685 [Gilliamella apicola]